MWNVASQLKFLKCEIDIGNCWWPFVSKRVLSSGRVMDECERQSRT